jgi:hypothetical protein
MQDADGERRRFHIFTCLYARIAVDVNARDFSQGETLRHHECHESRTRSNIQNTIATMCPHAKKGSVGSNFHRAAGLSDSKSSEPEKIVRHKNHSKNTLQTTKVQRIILFTKALSIYLEKTGTVSHSFALFLSFPLVFSKKAYTFAECL